MNSYYIYGVYKGGGIMALDSIDKKVMSALKANPSLLKKAQSSATFIKSLEPEVENLRDCILKYTKHNSVINSISIKKESDGTFTIYFDESKGAIYSSYFNNNNKPWYNTYTASSAFSSTGYPNAYMPLLRNEGYSVNKKPWNNFFGKGASGEAEHFIEKGIQDYKSIYGDNLSIRVEKSFDSNYGSSFNEVTDY